MSTAGSIDAAVVAAWEGALATYSGALDEHRSLLFAIAADPDAEHGVEPIVDPPLLVDAADPADLGPLPESLLPWARQLLEQTNGLVQLAADLAERSARAVPARASAQRTRLVAADTAASTWDTLL